MTCLAAAGYRSLHDVIIALGLLTLITGGNGSGKSSLSRSLGLLSEAAKGRLIATLANEGGLSSTMWAGPERFSSEMISGRERATGTVRSGQNRSARQRELSGVILGGSGVTLSHYPRPSI